MELELLRWGDGTIRLYFEDYLEGKDRVFILWPDGTAAEDNDELTPVNLVLALRAMIEEAPHAD